MNVLNSHLRITIETLLASGARQRLPARSSLAWAAPGQRAIYGLANLTRTYARADIEAVCARLLEAQCVSYAAVRRALDRDAKTQPEPKPALTQSSPEIRTITEYQSF